MMVCHHGKEQEELDRRMTLVTLQRTDNIDNDIIIIQYIVKCISVCTELIRMLRKQVIIIIVYNTMRSMGKIDFLEVTYTII